jgi:hypothetical protein
MVTLKRVGVKSAGLIGFWLGAALTITQITIFILMFTLSSSAPPEFLLRLDFWVAILRIIISVALQTAVFFGASAYIYNLISKWHGGLKLEFETLPVARKRKNDEIADDETGDDTGNHNGPGDTKERVDIQ